MKLKCVGNGRFKWKNVIKNQNFTLIFQFKGHWKNRQFVKFVYLTRFLIKDFIFYKYICKIYILADI